MFIRIIIINRSSLCAIDALSSVSLIVCLKYSYFNSHHKTYFICPQTIFTQNFLNIDLFNANLHRHIPAKEWTLLLPMIYMYIRSAILQSGWLLNAYVRVNQSIDQICPWSESQLPKRTWGDKETLMCVLMQINFCSFEKNWHDVTHVLRTGVPLKKLLSNCVPMSKSQTCKCL